jgi:CubicO group peptidase (beta-lactamase class C family)
MVASSIMAISVLAVAILAGCGPSGGDPQVNDDAPADQGGGEGATPAEQEAPSYAPLAGDDWEVSTPAREGLDPDLVEELYDDAAELETVYGLLVVKNGHLIAEDYFNNGSVDETFDRASATKSFTSALVGIALEQGCLSSVDQKMLEFFPEYADQITDARKKEITIRQMLQMRGGYPDEEYTPPYMEILYFTDNWHHVPHLVDFPLTADPGATFQYSNLTSHLLAVIVARACEADLMSFAQEHLISLMDARVGDWYPDADDYRLGGMGIFVTARDMAKFGLLYLNEGEFMGGQVLAPEWVGESLQRHSERIRRGGSGRYGEFRDLGYGYQWWSGQVGKHEVSYAAGHGGNYIVLLEELDMVIVTTADPMHGVFGSESWKHEGAINRLVGRFIRSLPDE